MATLVFKQTSGDLPTTEYDFVENGVSIGRIQIRHRPSHSKEVPGHMASHVYYEIVPEYRGRGFGKEILKEGLKKAKELGLNEVSVTCYSNNTASKKIIEKNGGKFVESAEIPATGRTLLKYNIIL